MSNSYLITWNPIKWNFEGGYNSFLQQVEYGEKTVIEWTVNSSSIKLGDVLYLMRLGEEPRGIIAKGISLSDVHLAAHFDPDRAKAGEKTKHITVLFLSAVDYTKDKYLSWNYLKKQFPNQMWTPQSSGIEIRNEYVAALSEAWEKCAPSYNLKKAIEILANTSSIAYSINTPMKPKGIVRKNDGSIRYICGRCGGAFMKSLRCPECGQLVKG